jgi:hypothetical protein
MLADYSVELGRDDPALELPWTSEDATVRHVDLKSHPERLREIPEAAAHPELAAFLARINAPEFPLATAKCDAWASREILPEEEVFAGECKFASYIDLVFAGGAARLLLEKHEELAQRLCRLLKQAPDIAASIEFAIRRCYYHQQPDCPGESESGFYVTMYVNAFGESEEAARKQWTIALALAQHALVQAARGVVI